MAWAFATVIYADAPLFLALARATEQHVGQLNPQNLANTAGAFAALRQSDEKLFTFSPGPIQGRDAIKIRGEGG